MTTNPFFEIWNTPFGAPPFDRIEPAHYRPAYQRALVEHQKEIAAIADNAAAPDFANTIVALEKSGALLTRVESVFGNLASSHTNEQLQDIERELSPALARHWNEIYLNAKLFARIDAVYHARESASLSSEELRVLKRYHLDFLRAGAQLSGEARKQFAAANERLASLGTEFGQKILADEQEFVLPLSEADLAGLPPSAKAAAAETARERGLDAPFAITTSRSSIEPFLQFSTRRDLREKVFKAWSARGDNANAHDTKNLISETVKLRTANAKLMGYPSFAHYKLADTMAKTPDVARGLLKQVWEPARARAAQERDALQDVIRAEGGNFALEAWDWRFYAEKLRKARYDLDENEIRPYFALNRMIEAAFYTASRLFGLAFKERTDIPVYHPDVRVWEVTRDGAHIGLFYGDYFARQSKRGGAWMSAFRDQHNIDAPVTPIIVNVCNFSKPPKNSPALLSFDEAQTLFHEFGHGLHGLLSDVRFPRLSGTNVAQDFVELPSQLFEHWLSEPQILERFALHCDTGEAIPKMLLDKLKAARNFNQGFATVEFVASALVDMDFHTLEDADNVDAAAFEAAALERIGMPKEIAMRHRSPHFLHIFSGDSYAAGYYSYLWAEVLDADGFGAFTETGDVFDAQTAQRLYTYIYSSGGTRDFAQAYRQFRGRDPNIEALLEGRGLYAA